MLPEVHRPIRPRNRFFGSASMTVLVEVPVEALVGLRRRVAAARWPDRRDRRTVPEVASGHAVIVSHMGDVAKPIRQSAR